MNRKGAKDAKTGAKCLLSLIVMCLVFAACAPAATPEHLRFTPGPAAMIAGSTFTTDTFTLQYPDGWRVITGQADTPQTVMFVSPDNCTIILVAVGTAEPVTSPDCSDATFQTADHVITLDTTTLTIAGSAPTEQWDTFIPRFEQVMNSLQRP